MRAMRISALLIALLVVNGCAEPGTEEQAEEAQGIHGGWVVSEWSQPEGVLMPAERGLFLFTESGHYSMMWVPTADRPDLPEEEPSDEELAAAYMTFVANSGRYSVSGNLITYEAYMARDPAYMSGFEPMGGEGNVRSLTYTLNDDGTLTLEFVPDDVFQAGTRAVLRRPGE